VATFIEMLEGSFFLIVNTVGLIIVTMSAGTIIDWLSAYLSSQPAGPIGASPVQYAFGTFYGMIIAIEIGLFFQLFLTSIKRTDYDTGDF
jgi:hypothetical protein